jgi:hypothetical protein
MHIFDRDGFSDFSQGSQRSRDAALLRATTELFVQEPSHDRDEIRRYEELALHFLPRVTAEDRIHVAGRLAERSDAPQSVIRMLAKDAIEVAREVLARSPVLCALDLLSVIAATGPDHHRLIAERPNLAADVVRALKLVGDPDALSSSQGAEPAAANPSPAAAPAAPRAWARELPPPARGPARIVPLDPDLIEFRSFIVAERSLRLRLMADLATWPPRRPYQGPGSRLDHAFRSILGAAQIVGFARRNQRRELIAAIAEGLGLPEEIVLASLDDRSGEPVAILLKALGLDNIQAQQVLLLATPAIGQDVNVFFRLVDLYAAMEPSVAEILVASWRGEETPRVHRHETHFAENSEARRTGVAVPIPGARDRRPAADEGEALAG